MTDDNKYHSTMINMDAIDEDNPWPGLLPYREKDYNYFFGRKLESEELYRMVNRSYLTVFFGISGLGKTSLLQAGLFPLLRRNNFLPIYIRLGYSQDDISLVNQVKQAIKLETSANEVEAPPGNDNETLWEYFHRKNADFWNKRNQIVLPLIVFDQFEEIFTLGKMDANRASDSESFLTELGDLIEGRPPKNLREKLDSNPQNAQRYSFGRHYYKVLISLREDYIPELEDLNDQIPSIGYNRFRLFRMNGTAAFQVVSQARNLIDPEIAEQVVRFVAASEHSNSDLESLELEPALLSVVCYELNLKRQRNNEPAITENLLEGSQEEILIGFYQRCLDGFSNKVQSFIEERLLTVSGYRDSVALENALSSSGITRDIIDRLVNRRLIRIDERIGRQRIELTHDLLTGVISSNRDQRHRIEVTKKRENEIIEKEQQKLLKERARKSIVFRYLSVTLALLFLISMFSFFIAFQQRENAISQYHKAIVQKKLALQERQRAEYEKIEAEKQKLIAQKARSDANERYQRITESIKFRQTVLSRDYKALNNTYQNFTIEKEIKWRAIGKEYPYKSKTGSPTYKFQIFPIEESIPGGVESIALITYVMDHPSFLNPLLSTGPDTKFKGTYDGVGCLASVTAVIEYSNFDKPIAIAEIPMCRDIEWIYFR